MIKWELSWCVYLFRYGNGEWIPELRNTYNLYDPVVRSTVQVYPGGWSAVYAFLDNPGMWNLRSQLLKHWYLGEELYVRVFNGDPNPIKERPAPENLLLCGMWYFPLNILFCITSIELSEIFKCSHFTAHNWLIVSLKAHIIWNVKFLGLVIK